MKNLIERLEQAFDTVVIDAPPLLPVTDAAVLSQHVGGVVVVVGTQKLKRQDLEKALKALELVESKVLGVVLNRLPSKGPDAYSYSYYGKEDLPKAASTKTRGRAKKTKPAKSSDVVGGNPTPFDEIAYVPGSRTPTVFSGTTVDNS